MRHAAIATLVIFAACSQDGAQGPEGPTGPQGPQGPMGAMGDPGTMGNTGAMGNMGTAGQSVTVASEPAGANCPGAGIKVTSMSGTTYVCNGANGQGVTVAPESAGANCAAGGIKVQNGASTTFVCNGVVDLTKAIANGTTPQTASFNITGNGTIGGTLTINDLADATSSLLSTVIDALQITGVGVAGSRLIRLFDNVNVSGTLTAGGGISTPTLDVTKFDTCPKGYTVVSLPHSTLCVQNIPLPTPGSPASNNYFAAELACNQTAGGQLCTHQQMLRYCISNLPNPNPTNTTVPTVPLVLNSWIGERAGDSLAIFININDCNDFDGAANSGTTGTVTGAYCCLEWMKYF
jgi:hypothetical protein